MAHLHSLTAFKNSYKFDNNGNDTPLTLLRDKVKTRIETYLGKLLTKQEYTETIRRSGVMIPLKALPVDEAEDITITIIDDQSAGGTTQVLTDTEYDITSYGILLAAPLKRNQKIQVVYTGGYASSTVDGESVLTFDEEDNSTIIKFAALQQLMHEWNRRLKPDGETITTDVGTVEGEPLELLEDVKNMLNAVRHPRMRWFA